MQVSIFDSEYDVMKKIETIIKNHTAYHPKCFTNIQKLIDESRKIQPEILFIDLDTQNSIVAISIFRKEMPSTKIIAMTEHKIKAIDVFDYKLDGFLLKPVNEETLIKQLTTIKLPTIIKKNEKDTKRMTQKEYKEYFYIKKEDYDKKIKVNNDELKVYSKKKLKELYPNKDYLILGETFEKKKRHKDKDIGRVELNEKRLNVGNKDDHCKLFRKIDSFVEVNGGFIALLKLRLLPIILLLSLLLVGICGGFCVGKYCKDRLNHTQNEENDPNIKPVPVEIITISGTVSKNGEALDGASISLQIGNKEVTNTTTDNNGNYLISDVENGNYNLVCTYDNSTLTKIAIVSGSSITIDFRFPANDLNDIDEIVKPDNKEDLPIVNPSEENTDVKALVSILDDNTPAIAVGGLESEAMLNMIVGKEVDITLLAKKLDKKNVPAIDRNKIESISGELELEYYDFSVLKEIFKNKVLESSEYLLNTKTILEIAVPYDSSKAVGSYVFRYHNDNAIRFDELNEKPKSNYLDGTYYVTSDTIYIYTNCFSTYAIGSAYVDQIVKGSDTITYSDEATINLSSNKINMMYKHDYDSSNSVRLQIFLVGENGNLLISESGVIPVGYEITTMDLLSNIKGMPSVGTYNGLMKIIYLDVGGDTSTNVDIPLNIVITR